MLNYIEKSKEFLKKQLVFVGVACMLCLSACGVNKDVETEALKIVNAIEIRDMKTIKSLIWGTVDLVSDEELSDFFIGSESEGDGIISQIIEQDSIKIKKITDKYIIYEITAPELSNIFNDAMKIEDLNADSFQQYIYNYIVTADKTKLQIEVPYTYEDGIFTANYSSQFFINGITGNLITAYQNLIQQMILENSEENIK